MRKTINIGGNLGILLSVLIFIGGPLIWITNGVKCITALVADDYKMAIIHAIGIPFFPISIITVWF